MGLVVTKLLITRPVVSWTEWETPPHPTAPQLKCHSLHDLERGQRGGRLGHLTYSLVSIRKNVFWLKQNSICSDRILTFGIRSRFMLRRDGDQCGLPEAIVAGAMDDVAED